MSAVTNNPTANRYELALDGALAIADYYRQGNKLTITHVEVPPAMQGKGIASKLMEGVVADAKAHGLTLVPLCPFAVAYLKRNK